MGAWQAWASTEATTCSRGRGWSPGRPGFAAALLPPARARRPAARSAPPGQARTGNPPQRPRELANARTASGHEHQGDEATDRTRKSQRRGSYRVWGEMHSPSPGCEE
jgi:hypothetical protein